MGLMQVKGAGASDNTWGLGKTLISGIFFLFWFWAFPCSILDWTGHTFAVVGVLGLFYLELRCPNPNPASSHLFPSIWRIMFRLG